MSCLRKSLYFSARENKREIFLFFFDWTCLICCLRSFAHSVEKNSSGIGSLTSILGTFVPFPRSFWIFLLIDSANSLAEVGGKEFGYISEIIFAARWFNLGSVFKLPSNLIISPAVVSTRKFFWNVERVALSKSLRSSTSIIFIDDLRDSRSWSYEN